MYVDDILIAAKSDARIAEVKTAIAGQFETTNMGKLHYFLGVKVIQNLKEGTVWLGQPVYSETLVRKFNLQDAKTRKKLNDPSVKQVKGDNESTYFNQELYQSAVGKLLYLSTRMRPDIAFTVSTCSCEVHKQT